MQRVFCNLQWISFSNAARQLRGKLHRVTSDLQASQAPRWIVTLNGQIATKELSSGKSQLKICRVGKLPLRSTPSTKFSLRNKVVDQGK